MRTQLLFSLLSALPFARAGAVPTFLEARDTATTSTPDSSDTAANWGQQVEVVYEFPKPSWVENLVVRPSGQILATLVFVPELWQVDPWQKTAQKVYTFPSPYNGLIGIAGASDTYYLVSGTFQLSSLNVTAHQFAIWQVQMTSTTGASANVKKITNLNDGVFLNGLEIISTNPVRLLVADSRAGVVYRVDVAAGTYTKVLDNALLKPTSPTNSVGVNGLKYDGSKYLYFSNTAQAILGRVPINADGTAAGAFSTLTTNAPIDDFVLKPQGGAYLCLDPLNQFASVGPNYGPDTVLVDSSNSTELLGPTAARFGRTQWDSNAVYVSTNGGLAQWATKNFVVGGRISRIWVGNS